MFNRNINSYHRLTCMVHGFNLYGRSEKNRVAQVIASTLPQAVINNFGVMPYVSVFDSHQRHLDASFVELFGHFNNI